MRPNKIFFLALFSLFLLYVTLSKCYEYTQYHFFDPYYQTPLPELSALSIKPVDTRHRRIVVLGGSTTANRFLDNRLRFTTLLQQRLNATSDSVTYEVLNCGMDWHTVKHAAVAYVTEYRNLKPDVVVIFHGINDLYRSFTPSKYALGTYREDYSHFYGSAINGANPPSFEKYLYTTFFENLGENYFINRSPMYFEISKFVSLASYEKYITNLTDILIRDSIKVCLLSQPSLYKDVMSNAEAEKLWLGKSFCSEQTGVFSHQYADVQSLKYALDSLNRITAKVANNYHVDFFDLAAAIPKNSSFFIDDVHFTPEANQLIAEKLFIHLSTKQQ